MGDNPLNKLKSIILLSWLVILAEAGAIIYLAGAGMALKKTNALLEKKLMSMAAESERSRLSRGRSESSDEKALKFVEWQFVVRDQSDRFSKRLETELSKEKETRKNYALLNAMHYNLGISYINSMDFGSAIGEFQKAVKFKADDKWSFYNLGMLYSVQPQGAAKAIEYYKKFLALAGDGEPARVVKERLEGLTKKKE